MSQYKEKILVHYVERLEMRVVLSLLGWTVVGLMFASAWTHLQMDVLAVERVASLGRLHVDTVRLQEQAVDRLIFWGIVGAITGLVKSLKYRVRAQEVLCMVEQERMLRQMIGRTERSYGQQQLVSK